MEKTIVEYQKRPSRVVIDKVLPQIDGGKFSAKRFIDEDILITAFILVDGHDHVKGRLLFKHSSETKFQSMPLSSQGNDEWIASFKPIKLGEYQITIEAAIDRFDTWRSDILKKAQAGQDITVDIQYGLQLLESQLKKKDLLAFKNPLEQLKKWSSSSVGAAAGDLQALLSDEKLDKVFLDILDKDSCVRYDHVVPILIEPAIARFSSWYEFFPRSRVDGGKAHGTFKDAEDRLPYVKELGFNVLYFPPIHPIGISFRKGKNNSLDVKSEDVGSPWAIGSAEGGHKSILPALGTFADFDSLVKKARSMGIEMAMDLAFQCSPDHPYVKEHPEWFKKRPDGSIQYAENPPKKYQDIYPFDFESEAWESLWLELRDITMFWIAKGIRIFRVDNPHTKPFHFWEWLISSIRKDHPEVIFLAEAFTRPKIMAYLAKVGFSQSYTYFTWRNVKWELTQYMTELTQSELADYFGPNFWPNTPDILPFSMQKEDRSIFVQRLILAGTLSSSYGIYGPAFELMETKPFRPGAEEYLDSEKYELKSWNLTDTKSLAPVIRKMNEIRQQCRSLRQTRNFRLLPIGNDSMFAFAKFYADEKIIVIVNLDSAKVQSALVELPLLDWKIDPEANFEVQDLLSGTTYTWRGWRNFVELHPEMPAHIFKVKILESVKPSSGKSK